MTQQAVALEPTPARYAHPLARYFAATRPAFLTATLTAVLLGLAIAHHDGVLLDVPTVAVTLLLALLAHAGVNVLNDYYDALNGTDAANDERLFPYTGGSRFIQNGVLSPGQTALFGYALLLLCVPGGWWLAGRAGGGLLLIGVAGLFIGWAYSALPFKLNSRGLGEFCVLLGFLGVVVGADYVQRHAFSLQPWLLGLPYALLVTSLLYINQFPDRKADAAAGKHHWVVRLTLDQAIRVYPLLVLLALLVLGLAALIGSLPPLAWLAALPLLFSAQAGRVLLQSGGQPAALLPAIRLTLMAMLSHGLLLSLILFLESR